MVIPINSFFYMNRTELYSYLGNSWLPSGYGCALSAESLVQLWSGNQEPTSVLYSQKQQQKPQSNSIVINFQTSFVKYLLISDIILNIALLKMAVTNLSGLFKLKVVQITKYLVPTVKVPDSTKCSVATCG